MARAHGLTGAFYVSYPDLRFLTLKTAVRIGDVETVITRRAGTDKRPLIEVQGINAREQAAALSGTDILASTTNVTLGPDEYWAAELEGCTVVDGQVEIGNVRALRPLPSCEVIVVDRTAGSGRGTVPPVSPKASKDELLIPLVSDAIRSIDVDQKRIDVDLRFLGESLP